MSLDLVLSILVLGAIALLLGAIALWRRGARQKAVLMFVLVLVAAGNVALLTVPDASGSAPLGRELK